MNRRSVSWQNSGKNFYIADFEVKVYEPEGEIKYKT